jgi:hypothetical protein
VADKVITPAPPPPPDKRQTHWMVWWSMGSAALVANNGGLGLQDPPWMNTRPPPPGDNDTSPPHSPVLLTPAYAGDFVEVTVQCSCRMMTCSMTLPPPLVTTPLATTTSFPSDFGYWGSKHNTTAPSDDKANLHTVGVTAPQMHLDMISDVGPMAAFSLQAFLENSFKLIFSTASMYGANNAPMQFCRLFSESAWVVDCALMEMKDKNGRRIGRVVTLFDCSNSQAFGSPHPLKCHQSACSIGGFGIYHG